MRVRSRTSIGSSSESSKVRAEFLRLQAFVVWVCRCVLFNILDRRTGIYCLHHSVNVTGPCATLSQPASSDILLSFFNRQSTQKICISFSFIIGVTLKKKAKGRHLLVEQSLD